MDNARRGDTTGDCSRRIQNAAANRHRSGVRVAAIAMAVPRPSQCLVLERLNGVPVVQIDLVVKGQATPLQPEHPLRVSPVMTFVRNDKSPILARYRPGQTFWFLIFVFGGLGGALPAITACTKHTRTDLMQAWILGGIAIFVGVGLALISSKAIDADDMGLTCIDWRGRRRIPWTEIQDYYLHLPLKRSQSATIQTAQGRIMISDIDRGYEAMLQCVREHTGHLSVKDWEILGCRQNDPATIVFKYTWRLQVGIMALSAAMTVYCLLMVTQVLIRDWQLLSRFAGLGWAVALVIVALQCPVIPGLMTWASYLQAKDCWGRRNDRITITAHGIRFENSTKSIDAPWASVMEWHSQATKRRRLLPSNVTIHTEAEAFNVSSQIGTENTPRPMRLLRTLLERYAGPDTQPQHDGSVFPNAAKRWASHISEGAQVHHYRTPINRAHLLMVCGYASIFPVALVAGYAAGTLAASTIQIVAGAIVLAAVVAYAQWRYRTAAVITDDFGIRSYTVFGKRCLRWAEITEYSKGDHLATVRGKRGAIRFWLTISDAEQLQKSIQERAGSGKTHEWKS